jgi:starch synthase
MLGGLAMKILFATGEAYPFVISGSLGDVSGSLPRSLHDKLVDCRVVLPLYLDIPDSLRSKMKYIAQFRVQVAWRNQYCGVFEAYHNGIIYYFIDNEYYFKRKGIYDHFDDAERFTFFSKAVLDLIQYIDYKPDIIHANDWQTALVPVYRKLLYNDKEEYKRIRTVFTIHNIANQGKYPKEIFFDILGFNPGDFPILEYKDNINFIKAAIVTADAITTVSPTYAEELKDPFYAYGLEDIIKENSFKLTGIINGIDIDRYNPETDVSIIKNYSDTNISGKKENKAALQKLFGLPMDDTIPVMGIISKLVDQKGLELLKNIIEDILNQRMQLVLLGKGDPLLETFYQDVALRYPGKMAIKIGFLPDIALKVYAGADMMLIPSKSEPCGLTQMVSLRYGTIPVVRETGGLKDTVTDCSDCGNGFSFKLYDAQDMLAAIRRAEEAFYRKDEWDILVKRALSSNFCWQNSADKYIDLYKTLLDTSSSKPQTQIP